VTSVETENEADRSKAPALSFAPSKWETVDESELESQGDVLCFVLGLFEVSVCWQLVLLQTDNFVYLLV